MKRTFTKIAVFAVFIAAMTGCTAKSAAVPSEVSMTKQQLMDKIKGGWAGQAIGCTFGSPTEFRYTSTMINPNIAIEWPEHYLQRYFDRSPGLYDDIYMDLTFVDVFDKEGLDAPVESFAKAFASAAYPLWHANQQARYNINNGIMPPQSGYWKNNPHADDIDFQIEADYAGLMAPGMINAATYYSDAIGHIMNYGDGWYGGAYVAAMYALAFVSDDIDFIVEEALKVIPQQSRYYRCMADIISWHKKYPEAWQIAWALCERDYNFDIGCPEGVYKSMNIDAVINSAYIVIGLLYGEGDLEKTMEISTRCGQDSDCNPASAAGILCTMLGYSNIPEKWMPNLREVEDRNFAYTDISLNKAYRMSFNQALQVIERGGGKVGENDVTIKTQKPETLRFEESFAGLWPKEVNKVDKAVSEAGNIEFVGKGCVMRYRFVTDAGQKMDQTYVANVEVYLDGTLIETVSLPVSSNQRKLDLYYNYDLENKGHTLSFKLLNPLKGNNIILTDLVVYTER